MRPFKVRISDTAALEMRERLTDAAFSHFFNQMYPDVLRAARDYLKNPEDAEEATSDVFLKVWNKLPAWNPRKGTFHSWLFVLVRNTLTDRYRAQKRERHKGAWVSLDTQVTGRDVDSKPLTFAEWLLDSETPILDALVIEAQMARVLSVWAEIPHRKQRMAWWLRHIEGYAWREIARILKSRVGSCKVWQHRCTAQIRRGLRGVA